MEMDWTSILAKEYEFLKIQRENQTDRIWHENLSATSQRNKTNSAKWDTELDDVTISNDKIYNVFVLPPQTPSPSMTMWLPISRNFVTKDFEDPRGTPHFSGYDGNGRDLKRESIDDEMFVSLVQRMATYKNKIDQNAVPNAVIFETINSYFDGNYTADKYTKLTKCNTPSCTPNIDEPMGATVQPHQSLRAYRKYFCRRCYLYNCQLHPPADNVDETSFPRDKIVDELKPFTEPCSSTCYLTTKIKIPSSPEEFELFPSKISQNAFDQTLEDVIANDSIDKPQSPITQTMTTDGDDPTDSETEWSPSDQSFFLILFNVFPYNCCAIAKTMRKPCEQVYRRMVLMDPPTRREAEKRSSRKERSKFYGKLQQHLAQTYSPCNHTGPCSQTAKCLCQNCEKYCSCGPECGKRMPKCLCKGSCTTMKCICYSDQRECDADCECHSCKNMAIQIGRVKELHIIPSSIHGWGVVVAETCLKDDFIAEYKGEIISNKECERRERVYDKNHCTYMFSLNGDSVIDARFFGNKLRFLNFCEKPNCYCRVMMVNGDHRIGVYAARNIAAGEELTIDYVTYDPTADKSQR